MPEGMSFIGWIVIGLLAGAIAGWFVPGRERNGCLGTMLIGIVGRPARRLDLDRAARPGPGERLPRRAAGGGARVGAGAADPAPGAR